MRMQTILIAGLAALILAIIIAVSPHVTVVANEATAESYGLDFATAGATDEAQPRYSSVK
jgi:hypothetical protein